MAGDRNRSHPVSSIYPKYSRCPVTKDTEVTVRMACFPEYATFAFPSLAQLRSHYEAVT
jgi:hypothetical protein